MTQELRFIISLLRSSALVRSWIFAALFLMVNVAQAAPSNGFVLQREGWSFDRSNLEWSDPSKTEEKGKTTGSLMGATGWAEYDIDVPSSGWFELWEKTVPEWTREVYLDGSPLFWLVVSPPEDEVKSYGGFHEANIYLTKGKHTIRFRRLGFPGILPSQWELRASDGDPEGTIRIVKSGENVLRAGVRVPITIAGGTTVPTSYELFLSNQETKELTPAGSVDFPVSEKSVEKVVKVAFAAQGVFRLVAKVNGTVLRPAVLKSGEYVVIDTKNPPKPAAELKTKSVVDINCAAEPPKGTFWEKDGQTEVVTTPFGSYRESSGKGKGGDGFWGMDGFSYRVDLPEAQRLYRLRVDYPDDERRTVGFWVNDYDGTDRGPGVICTGGVETGDHYPLTYRMQTHEAYFYPENNNGVIVAAISLVPGMKAAASRIRIDLVESGLPAASLGQTGVRSMGFYFEEGPRWQRFFGAKREGNIAADLEAMDRWGQWNRYLGANLMFPTCNVYQANLFPSKILDGYFSTTINQMRMAALIAEKYKCKFSAEFYLTGQTWFNKYVMGIWSEKHKENGREIEEVKFASPEAEELVLRDRNGGLKCGWKPFMYNALNPKVQEKYISVFGELADSLADCESFDGISTRMMMGWLWQGWDVLPGSYWGYDDWTVGRFSQETGIKVPGMAGDPLRFQQRYEFLTGPQKEKWTQWRCAKIFDYHQRLLARIQKAKPSAKLTLNWFGQEPGRTASPQEDILGQMREVGMDWRMYQKQKNIVVVPSMILYGRRYSTPLADAKTLGSLSANDFQTVGRLGARGMSLYTNYFEVNGNLDWTQLGGKYNTKKNNAFDACAPSGVNEREIYALGLADCDSSFIFNGGNGWMFGTPAIMQPFLREYRALPAVQFKPCEKARDPVALWQFKDQKGNLWFYAVNRLSTAVKVSLGVRGAKVFAASGGEALNLKDGSLNFTLEPFMLKSFRAKGGAELTTCNVDVPDAFVGKLARVITFAWQIRSDLADGHLLPELSAADAEAAIASLDKAAKAFDKGEYGKARAGLESAAAIQVYYLSGIYPQGLLERSSPLGVKSMPDPEFVSLGKAEDRLIGVADLSFDAAGALWVTSGEQGIGTQVKEFSREGRYMRAIPLFNAYNDSWDIRNGKMAASSGFFPSCLKALPGDQFAAQFRDDEVVIFGSKQGRMKKFKTSYGISKAPCHLLSSDAQGRLLVSCLAKGYEGVSEYEADGRLRRKLGDIPAMGGAINAEGGVYLSFSDSLKAFDKEGQEIDSIPERGLGKLAVTPDGSLLLAVTTDGGSIVCFRRGTNGKLVKAFSKSMPTPAAAIAVAPDGRVAVGFRGELADGVVVREYALGSDSLEPSHDLVRGVNEVKTQSLGGITQLKVYQGKLYYGAYGKLMRLIPGVNGASDTSEVACDPKFKNAAGFDSFAFAPNGDLYLASHWNGSARGVNLYHCRKTGDEWSQPEYLNGDKPLVEGSDYSPTDLAVDASGKLIVRLANSQTKKAPQNNLSLYRWSPDGAPEELVDLGDIYGSFSQYGLYPEPDGSMLVAGARTIERLSPTGKPLWSVQRALNCPPGYVDLRCPAGITSDSKGNIWVTDPIRHQVLKLSQNGQILGSFGQFGTACDSKKLLFNHPVGVATVHDGAGAEWLYVADIGNQRFVKWKLE